MNSLPDSRKYRVMLLGAVLCVAMATACRLDVFIGAEGNSGAGSVSGSSAAGPATNGNGGNLGPGDQPAKDDGGIDDSASLPAVKSVLALSVSAAADYALSLIHISQGIVR